MTAAAAHVLAVVVLYRTTVQNSKTLAGLTQAFAEWPELMQQIELVVWDNSPTAQAAKLPFVFTYRHAAENAGVGGAYNAAATIAAERGCAWLLLLDHDTAVTADFLRGMLHEIRKLGEAETRSNLRVAAIVPFLYAGSFCMSPQLWRFARHVPLARPDGSCLERRAIFAANSGTLLRVDALAAVGGYSPRFWLDFSDIELFHRLHRKGFAVWVAGHRALEHDMAMLDYDRRMTPERYAIFLAAEGDFMDLYRGPAERAVHLLRLAARVLHQRSYADPVFSRMSGRALAERLTVRRRARLARRGNASDPARRQRENTVADRD